MGVLEERLLRQQQQGSGVANAITSQVVNKVIGSALSGGPEAKAAERKRAANAKENLRFQFDASFRNKVVQGAFRQFLPASRQEDLKPSSSVEELKDSFNKADPRREDVEEYERRLLEFTAAPGSEALSAREAAALMNETLNKKHFDKLVELRKEQTGESFFGLFGQKPAYQDEIVFPPDVEAEAERQLLIEKEAAIKQSGIIPKERIRELAEYELQRPKNLSDLVTKGFSKNINPPTDEELKIIKAGGAELFKDLPEVTKEAVISGLAETADTESLISNAALAIGLSSLGFLGRVAARSKAGRVAGKFARKAAGTIKPFRPVTARITRSRRNVLREPESLARTAKQAAKGFGAFSAITGVEEATRRSIEALSPGTAVDSPFFVDAVSLASGLTSSAVPLRGGAIANRLRKAGEKITDLRRSLAGQTGKAGEVIETKQLQNLADAAQAEATQAVAEGAQQVAKAGVSVREILAAQAAGKPLKVAKTPVKAAPVKAPPKGKKGKKEKPLSFKQVQARQAGREIPATAVAGRGLEVEARAAVGPLSPRSTITAQKREIESITKELTAKSPLAKARVKTGKNVPEASASPLAKLKLSKGVAKEVEEVSKLAPKAAKRRGLSVILAKKAKGEKAIDVEAPSMIKERLTLLKDPDIPVALKSSANRAYSSFIERGLSDEAASEAVVKVVRKGLSKLPPAVKAEEKLGIGRAIGKTSLKKQEEKATSEALSKEERLDLLKSIGEAARKKGVFSAAEKKFANTPDNILDEAVNKEALKRGIDLSKLTTEQYKEFAKKHGKTALLAIGGLAAALSPEEAEANGIVKIAQSIFGKKTIASEAKRLGLTVTKDIDNAALAANRAVRNGKNAGVNVDRVTMAKPNITTTDQIFGAIRENLKQLGPEGSLVVRKMKQVDDFSERAQNALFKTVKQVLPAGRSNLNAKEGKVVFDALVGRLEKGERYLLETASGLRQTLNDAFDYAAAAGVKVVGKRENYFPQILKDGVLESPTNQAKLMDFLLHGDAKKGIKPQVETLEEATEAVRHLIGDRFSNLFRALPGKGKTEATRKFTLPDEFIIGGDGKNVLEAVIIYSDEVVKRAEMVRMFGPKLEGYKKLIDAAVKKNPADEAYIRNAASVMSGKRPVAYNDKGEPTRLSGAFTAPELVNKVTGTLNGIEAASLLGYAQVSQFAQLSPLIAKAGVFNTVKGIASATFNPRQRRDLAIKSGAVLNHTRNYLAQMFGLSNSLAKSQKAVVNTILTRYQIMRADRVMRVVASSAAAHYADDLAKNLLKSVVIRGGKVAAQFKPTAVTQRVAKETGRNIPGRIVGQKTRRQLVEMGVNPNKVLQRLEKRLSKVSNKEQYVRDIQSGKTSLFTDEEMLTIMKRLSDATQFRGRAKDLPLWFASDWAAPVKLFRTFVAQSGSFVNRALKDTQLLRRTRRGQKEKDLAVIARVIPSAAAIGAAVQGVRDNFKSKVGDITGQPRSYQKRIEQRQKRLIDRGSGNVLTEPNNILNGKSIAAVLDDATYAVNLGLVQDAIEDLYSREGGLRFIKGPAIDRVDRLLKSFIRAHQQEDFEPIKKELKRLTPFGLGRD